MGYNGHLVVLCNLFYVRSGNRCCPDPRERGETAVVVGVGWSVEGRGVKWKGWLVCEKRDCKVWNVIVGERVPWWVMTQRVERNKLRDVDIG